MGSSSLIELSLFSWISKFLKHVVLLLEVRDLEVSTLYLVILLHLKTAIPWPLLSIAIPLCEEIMPWASLGKVLVRNLVIM